jgi:hypothetical protein
MPIIHSPTNSYKLELISKYGLSKKGVSAEKERRRSDEGLAGLAG